MACPIRFVACTYNLWNTQRWPDRQAALNKFLELHLPDLLCVQELRPETQSFLDTVLKIHQRVTDSFEGWSNEGNIYWHSDLFELVEHGAEDIGMLETSRRLFWVRLRLLNTEEDQTLFVSTAHYTWYGNELERTKGINPRLEQARNTIKTLNKLVPPPEPLLFMAYRYT